jgi:hypothetical protein
VVHPLCPHCGVELTTEFEPRSGQYAVCMNCVHVVCYRNGHRVRTVTGLELLDMDKEEREDILFTQMSVRMAKNEIEGEERDYTRF